MNLNETMNSDFKKNELLDDESDVEEGLKGKQFDEESKYGKEARISHAV